MKLIPLTQGQVAKVSDRDFKYLSQYKWCAWWSPITKSFYAATKINGRQVYMQKVILPGVGRTDHKDHDTLNNQRRNLRRSTASQNNFNMRLRSDNTSGFKGVKRHKNKWRADITKQGNHKFLGLFETPQLAYKAYLKAAKRLFGRFAHGG